MVTIFADPSFASAFIFHLLFVHPRSTEEDKGGSIVVETTPEDQVEAPIDLTSVSAGPSVATVTAPEDQVEVPVETPIERINARNLPNQPGELFSFPQRECGKKNGKPHYRSFNANWCKKYNWLHYDEQTDKAFCFTCVKALQHNAVATVPNNADSFIKNGYSAWKKALGIKEAEKGKRKPIQKQTGFPAHANSDMHKEAVIRYIVAPSPAMGDVIDMMSTSYAAERQHNRKMLLNVLRNIRYLARQSLPLRGTWDEETGCELNSNFHQLMLLRSEEDSKIAEWIESKEYSSPSIQNEIIEVMALGVLKEISANIQNASVYTIMADESADVSNKEQVVVCIRWVDEELNAHEEFVGIKPVDRTTAEDIVLVLSKTLADMHLRIDDCRGQCYDGASTMSGAKSGVATRIKTLNAKCLFTHCYGHVLNLSVKDACSDVKCLKDTFDTAREICKLVKFSPQRDTHLQNLRKETQNEDAGVHAFCPTRWTIRGRTLLSLLNNHEELMDLWKWSLTVVKDTEMKARIIGIKSMMKKFVFLFGCAIGKTLLNQTDNLSAKLQSPKLSALEAQTIAMYTVKALKEDRNDNSFEIFWEYVIFMCKKLSIEQPVQQRKRKLPVRFDENQDTYHHPETPKEEYRKVYFECIDYLVNSIETRFNQPDYQIYLQMQELLLKSFRSESCNEELTELTKRYADDVDFNDLKTQLNMLPQISKKKEMDCKNLNIRDVIMFMRLLSPSERDFLSEVVKILKLILLAPATNAVSERSFSSLRRLKTYLRSTMGGTRLQGLMVLHIHKELTDSINLVDVANKFVGKCEKRKKIFGTFTDRDIQKAKKYTTTATQTC